MAVPKKQPLHKLSDEALLGRLEQMRDSLRELGETFDRDVISLYTQSDMTLAELESDDIGSRVAPVVAELADQIDKELEDVERTLAEEDATLERMAEDGDAEEAEDRGTVQSSA